MYVKLTMTIETGGNVVWELPNAAMLKTNFSPTYYLHRYRGLPAVITYIGLQAYYYEDMWIKTLNINGTILINPFVINKKKYRHLI